MWNCNITVLSTKSEGAQPEYSIFPSYYSVFFNTFLQREDLEALCVTQYILDLLVLREIVLSNRVYHWKQKWCNNEALVLLWSWQRPVNWETTQSVEWSLIGNKSLGWKVLTHILMNHCTWMLTGRSLYKKGVKKKHIFFFLEKACWSSKLKFQIVP